MVTIAKLNEITGLYATDMACLETTPSIWNTDNLCYFEDETGGTYDVMYPVEELFHDTLEEEVNCLHERLLSTFVEVQEPASLR